MGKVYSAAARTDSGVRASSAWAPDFSSYDLLPQFLRLEGLVFAEVQALLALWRRSGAPLALNKEAYVDLMRAAGLADRRAGSAGGQAPSGSTSLLTDIDSATGAAPVLSAAEQGQLELIMQFNEFRDCQTQFAGVTKPKAPRPKVSTLDVLTGLAVISKGTVEEKVALIFTLFDFKRKHKISRGDACGAIMSSVRGFCAIKGVPLPPADGLEWLCDERLMEFVRQSRRQLAEDAAEDRGVDLDDDALAKIAAAADCKTAEFTLWCKRDPYAETLLTNGACGLGGGNQSAFADRKRLDQRKLLQRLARIEAALEQLGEPRFEPTKLRAMLELRSLRAAGGKRRKQPKAAGNQPQNGAEERDLGAPKDDDQRPANQEDADEQAATTDSGLSVLFPGIRLTMRQLNDLQRIRQGAHAGIALDQYSALSQEDRDEFALASQMLWFLQECATAVLPASPQFEVSLGWLVSLAQRCGVPAFDKLMPTKAGDESLPAVHLETVRFDDLLDWIQQWPLADEVLARSSAGRYWAWARVIVGCAQGFQRVALEALRSQLVPVLDASLAALWVDRRPCSRDKIARTKVSLLIGEQEKEDFSIQAHFAYRVHGDAVPRVLEVYDLPELGKSADDIELPAPKSGLNDRAEEGNDTSRAAEGNAPLDRGEEARETPQTQEEVASPEEEQHAFELAQVEESELLNNGQYLYEQLCHEPEPSARGHLGRSGVAAAHGVGVAILMDFSSDIVASANAVTWATFKLKVLLTHPYVAGIPHLIGAHVVEFSEFVGSTRMVRLALFFDPAFGDLALSFFEPRFAGADTVGAGVEIGSNIGNVLGAQWDGSVSALWRFEREHLGLMPDLSHAVDRTLPGPAGDLSPSVSPCSVPVENKLAHFLRNKAQRDAVLHDNKEKSGLGVPQVEDAEPESSQGKSNLESRQQEAAVKGEEETEQEEKEGSEAWRLRARMVREELSHKDMTKFGLECVEAIIHKYDLDMDGSLRLDEMNELLKALGQRPFASQDDFEAAMRDEQLPLNAKGHADVETLALAYVHAPGSELAADIGRLGVHDSSLADCSFRFHVDATGPVVGRTCPPDAECPRHLHVVHVLDRISSGQWMGAVRDQIWRQHGKDTEVSLAYSDWGAMMDALGLELQQWLPAEAFELLCRVVFEPGCARNQASALLGFVQGLVTGLARAQVGCEDDEEDEEEEEAELADAEAEAAEAEAGGAGGGVPPDLNQRALLKQVHHFVEAARSVLAGVAQVRVGLRTDATVTAEFSGFDLLSWLLSPLGDSGDEG